MRSIVNISLPQPMLDEIEEIVAQGKFASKSEFFRHLVREWMESVEVRELKKAHNEMVGGKGIELKSLKDLRQVRDTTLFLCIY